jgi:hypothetical protein
MKKLLCIALFGLSLAVTGQKQSLYFAFAPVDLGVGVRYDHYFKDNGLYIAGSYGNYKLSYGYIHDHYKVSFGALLRTPALDEATYLSIGVCLHKYGEYQLPQDYDLTKIFSPFSYEVGAGAYVGRVIVGFRIDLYKWDSSIDIGFKF